eukprot:13614849-Alexandrium_andersonii.AAC.1
MSASLVGSEMCIRDRSAIHPRPVRAAIRLNPQSATRKMKNRFTRSSLEPVSYTHLTLPTICSV